MKTQEIYKIAIASIIHDDCMADDVKLEVLRELYRRLELLEVCDGSGTD